MSDPNGTSPDRVLTPTLATSAVHGISTLDPQPEDQPKENFSRITTSSKQVTESTDNQQEIKTDVSLSSHQGLHDHQTNMLETGLSESFEAVAIEYSGTSDSDPGSGSGSDMDSISDDEDSEDQATDEFVRTVTAHHDAPKDVFDSHNLETGDMEAIDPSQCNMEPASLPLIPTEDTGVIFENSYFQVKRSQLAGWGAFAIRRLEKGDKILVEKPLFKATNQTLFDGFANLGKPLRDVAYSLHANSNLERIKTGPIETLIWKTNAFSTDYEDSEAGLFPIASRFNHACNPMQTVDWHYNYNDQTLEMVVQADVVEAGEELTISYDWLSPLGLYDRYGFKCSCGGCPGLSDEQLAEREKRQW